MCVSMLPCPKPELPDILALGHLGLDTRRRLEISRGTLPVKMFSYMACALPVLLAIEGEATTLMQDGRRRHDRTARVTG